MQDWKSVALELTMRAFGSPLARRFERAAFDPRPAQERALHKVLRECRDSRLGRHFSVNTVRTLDDLKRLPPSDYESIRDASDRVYRSGASGWFGSSEVVAMALSSGTSGAPKRFPITRAFLAAHRRTMFTLQAALLHGFSAWRELSGGRQLLLGNSPEVERAPTGLPIGYISGIVLEAAPGFVRRRFLPRPELSREPNWDRRLGLILDEARDEDVRLIGAFPAALRSLTETAVARYGVRTLDEVWPNLRACFFGGTSLFSPVRAAVTRFWRRDGRLWFWENYSALEGMFGHSYRADWPGLAFSPFESVFLFSPDAGGQRLLLLDELEAGARYHVYITNQLGLCNYRMGDVIEITSRRPLTFRVIGRAVDWVSISWERITTAEAEAAFASVGAARLDFALYLDDAQPRRVVWVLPWAADAVDLATLDRALGNASANYSRLRESGFYGQPKAELLPAERFSAYRSRHLHEGTFKEKKIFQDRAAFVAEYGLTADG